MVYSALKDLLIASHNPGKIREFEALLGPLNIRVRSTAEFSLHEPEETGQTFAENAALKGKYYAEATGLPALSDDSGLVVPVLNGEPGIYSARWAGEPKNFTTAFDTLQHKLQNHPNAAAYFICVLCLWITGEEPLFFEGRLHGHLTFPPRGEHGFGYDPIFVPDGYGQTCAELDSQVKNRISHRAQALKQFTVAIVDN